MLTVVGLHLTLDVLVVGALRGLTIGLLAAGLVLVFRSTRVINLAHAQVGTLCAAVLGRLVVEQGVPYWVALPLALAAGVGLGVATEALVVRRLADAPRVVLLVATIGVSQLLVVLQSALPAVTAAARTTAFPSPLPLEVDLPHQRLGSPELMVLLLVPAVVAAVAVALSRTPTGLAVRAAAQNPDAAELAGISTRRVSAIVWGLAGGLSVLAAVLTLALDRTTVGNNDAGLLGPGLLLAGLTAALVGGLTSLPLALAGGVGVGVVTSVLLVSDVPPGTVTVVQLAAVVALVLLRVLRQGRRDLEGETETVTLTRGRPARPVPPALAHLWWVRHSGRVAAVAGLLLVAVVPLVTDSSATLGLATRAVLFGLLALSLTVLTGWAGQLSLGQVAFFGLAAGLTARLVATGVPFPAAVGLAAVAGALASVALGGPALLVRGLFLGVVTLALAVTTQQFLLPRDFFGGPNGRSFTRPGWVAGNAAYYWLCLGVVAVVAVGISHLRGTGAGLRIIAARANPERAASLTVGVAQARLAAFAVAGAVAGLAGGLFPGVYGTVRAGQLTPFDSLVVVAAVAVGGFGSVSGALLGTALVVGVPAAYGNSLTSLYLVPGIGLLVALLYLPGGLVSLVTAVRDAALDVLAARRATPAPPTRPPVTAVDRAPMPRLDDVPRPVLAAQGVSVAFGGRRALEGVDLVAYDGEVLGLIGSNGAGKSTLLGVLSGFVPPDAGVVVLRGLDVTRQPAHLRAQLGLGRIFQDARLFGDLTVRETLRVALEAHERSELVPSLLALPPSRLAERRKRTRADEVVDLLGLGAYADVPVSRLSTGTRRVVELGCLVAQEARVLLLDEPTAGLAQRETEAFGPLLLGLRDDLGATLVLVEHDIPLVTSVSDRVVCLGAGRTIADGTPAEVVADPAVVASYLGTDERAIARSGALTR